MTIRDLYKINMDMVSDTRVTIYGDCISWKGKCIDIPTKLQERTIVSFCCVDGRYIIMI